LASGFLVVVPRPLDLEGGVALDPPLVLVERVTQGLEGVWALGLGVACNREMQGLAVALGGVRLGEGRWEVVSHLLVSGALVEEEEVACPPLPLAA